MPGEPAKHELRGCPGKKTVQETQLSLVALKRQCPCDPGEHRASPKAWPLLDYITRKFQSHSLLSPYLPCPLSSSCLNSLYNKCPLISILLILFLWRTLIHTLNSKSETKYLCFSVLMPWPFSKKRCFSSPEPASRLQIHRFSVLPWW